MYDMRTYTQEELCKLFKTKDNAQIKKKLNDLGYIYTTEGRGKALKITLIDYKPPLHGEFKEYCKNVLGYKPQTDFDKLFIFFSHFMYDEDIRKLPYIEITRKLEKEMSISRQTISKWVKHLVKENVMGESNYNYFAHGYDEDGNKITVPISEKQYKDGWSEYWSGKETGYEEALNRLVAYVSGFPQKVPEKVFNAFEYKKIEKLMEIIDKEKNTNE